MFGTYVNCLCVSLYIVLWCVNNIKIYGERERVKIDLLMKIKTLRVLVYIVP